MNQNSMKPAHFNERPRSITIDRQSPSLAFKETVKSINSKNLPSWGELAHVIKKNFSPGK